MALIVSAGGAFAWNGNAVLASNKPVTIQFWNPATGTVSQKVMTALVNRFNATHPLIHVVNKPVSSANNFVKYVTAITSGSPPNVIMTYYGWQMSAWRADNLLQPLNKYISQDHISLATYFPAVYKFMKFHGQIYGLPQEVDEPLLAWNKTLFKQAGLNPNVPPKTIAQLTADAKRLTIIKNGKLQQVGLNPSNRWGNNVWVHFFGGDWYNYKTNRISANTSANIRAYSWMKSMYDMLGGYAKAEAFDAGFKNLTTSVGGNPFYTGKEAMETMGEWVPSYISLEAPHLNYGVAPLPVGPGIKYGSVQFISPGNFFVLPRGATHVKQSLIFMKWMASPYAVYYWCIHEGNLPPAPSMAFSAYFWKHDAKDRPWISAIKQATIPSPQTAIPTVSYYQTTRTAIGQEIMLGTLSPKKGLEKLQSQASQNLQQFLSTHPGS